MTKSDVLQMGPPATIGSMVLWGFTLEDWVLILSFVLLALQIIWFVFSKTRQLLREYRGEPEESDGS